MDQDNWTQNWFNEDYVRLYAHRGDEEAARDVAFIESALKLTKSDKILDAGCGFGRHVLTFAAKGYQVIGIDASKVLIERAKRIAKQRNLPETLFQHVSIQDFALLGQFDAVLSLFTSFGYSDDIGNKKTLAAINSHLKVGKPFFLDYLNPDYVQKHLVEFEEKKLDSETVRIERTIEDDYVIKTIHFPSKTYVEKVRLYDHPDLLRFISESGFRVEKTYGSFEGEAWTQDSERQIVISKKE